MWPLSVIVRLLLMVGPPESVRKLYPCVVCFNNETINDMPKKRLIIIGGGFAGLNLAKHVDKKMWDVVIIDRNNYHSFPPLLYQVASSGLEPASICFPLRRELNGRRFHDTTYRMGSVKSIDVAARTVSTQFETLTYDSLVIAAGTTNNFFGIPDLEKHVYTLKSTPEAIRCRNEVLDRLERASLCDDVARRRSLLTFVVVGGGASGVEIAGALGEMKRFVIKREYPSTNPDEVRVVIVEGTDALLRAMGPKSSADALDGLRQLCVEVQLGKTMKSYADRVLTFADGSTIETDTVIWTAGVTGVPIEITGADIVPARGNRWAVDECHRLVGADGVYAIGDIALMVTGDYPHGHPQVAQVALQQGDNLAHNLSHPEREPRPFKYHNKGSMATIGRNRAVVDMGRTHLSGRLAWWAWLFVHLMSLVGFRNRAVVFINWMWNYWTFSTGLRLLMRPQRYPVRNYWNE